MADTTNKQKVQLEFDFDSAPAHKKVDDLDKSIGGLQKSANAVTLYNLGKSAELVKKQLNEVVATMQRMNSLTLGQNKTSISKTYSSMRKDKYIDVDFEVVDEKQVRLLGDAAKQTDNINKAAEKTTENIKKASSATSAWSKVIEELTANWEKRIAIFLSYRALSIIKNTIDSSLESMVNLQAEFANIQAITGATDADMASLSKTIYEVGDNSRFSTEELAKATVTLGQAGLTATQIKDALASVNTLASATGASLSQAVDITTTAMGAWNMQASQAADIADSLTVAVNRTKADITTMANAVKYAGVAAADMGVSWQEFIATASAVTDVGLKGTNVGTGFRSVLTELVRPSERLQKVFKRLGIDIDEVNVEANGLTNTLKQLKEAGLDASEAFEGFDRRAATFYIAASDQLETTNQLREAFIQEGAALKANETQMGTFSSQVERFGNISKESIQNVFKPLLEILTKLLQVINDFSSGVFGKFITQTLTLTVAMKGFSTVFGGLLPIITKGWIKVLKLNPQLAISLGYIMKLTTAVKVLKKVLSGIASMSFWKLSGIGLITTGVAWGVNKLLESKSTEEQLQNQYDEQSESMKTVNSIYSELIEKQKLYSTDSVALAVRIEEINKALKLQGAEAISLTASYEDLTKAMLEYEFAKSKEQAKTRSAQGQAIMQKYIGYGQKGRELKKQGYGVYEKVSPTGVGGGVGYIETSDYFTKAFTANNEQLKQLKSELNAITEAGRKRALQFILDEAVTARSYMDEAYEKMGLSKEESSELTSIILKSEALATETKDKFIKKIKELSSTKDMGSFTSLYNTSNEITEEIQKQIEEAKTKLEAMKEKGVGKTSPEYRALDKAITDLEVAQSSIEERRATETGEILRKRMEVFTNRLREISQSVNIATQELTRWEKTLVSSAAQISSAYSGMAGKYTSAGGSNITQFISAGGTKSDQEHLNDIYEGIWSRIDLLNEMDEKYQETIEYEKSITAEEEKINKALKVRNLTEEERVKLNNQLDSLDRQKKEAEATKNNIADKKLQIEQEQQALQIAYEYQKQVKEIRDGWTGSFGVGMFDGAIKSIQNYISTLKDLQSTMEAIGEKTFTAFADNFTDAVVDFANGEKSFSDAMKDFISNTLKEIGNWLIQLSIKAAIYAGLKAIAPGLFDMLEANANAGKVAGAVASGATTAASSGKAAGGIVAGGTANRDSVTTKLMPGEYVLKKSAVDYLGENFLNNLNSNTSQTLDSITPEVGVLDDGSSGSVVNVWVVSEKDDAAMGPNDVIATISKDIRTGGTTRQLIKSVVAGRR